MFCFFSQTAYHLDLRSFPTRRSSDLSTRHGRRSASISHPDSDRFVRTRARDRSPRRAAQASRARSSRRSEEHTSELQSRVDLVCRLLLEKKKTTEANVWDMSRISGRL